VGIVTNQTSAAPHETDDGATRTPNQAHDVLERIRAEYLEMPGMRLTAMQVRRLCGVDAETCEAIESLVAMRFLSVNADGTYVRHTSDSVHSPTLRAPFRLVPRPDRRRAG
jgi:hypothetical protein